MHSECQGSGVVCHWHDIRALGLWTWVWRLGYEARKRLGLTRRPRTLDPEDSAAVLAATTVPAVDDEQLLAWFRRGRKGAMFFDPDRREQTVQAVRDLGEFHFMRGSGGLSLSVVICSN